jgi:RHS repeat-associated protein
MNSPELRVKKCVLLTIAAFFGLCDAAYMEAYNWQFQGGNLVSNWSFENQTTEICQEAQPGTGGGTTNCRDKRADAHTGNYVLSIVAKNEDDPALRPWAVSQTSRLLLAEPSTQYTFSVQMKVAWNERIPSSIPVVCWMRADKTFINCGQGQPYASVFPMSVSTWTPYSFTFTTPSDAQYVYFHLVQSANDGAAGGAGDSYQFDDVQIRRTADPSGLVEVRSYGNASGRVDHSIVNDGVKDVIAKRDYDALGRPFREYLPVTRTSSLASGEFVVSGLNLPGEVTVDYLTLQDAYADIAARVAAAPKSSLPGSFTFYAIVATSEDFAPLSASAASFETLQSSDGLVVPYEFEGVVRGSSVYADLVSRHHGPPSGHDSRGPFTGDIASLQAAQYPGESNLFTQIGYPTAGANAIGTMSLPGNGYGPAAHLSKSGSALLTSMEPPSSVEYNADSGDVEAPYTYSWSKDPQGEYAFEIRNERGLLVKTGVSVVAFPSSPADWIISTAGYDEFGRQIASMTPSGLPATMQYDGNNKVIQATDGDRGQTNALFDTLGQLRFTRSAEGLDKDYMVATQYDAIGRVLGWGKINQASIHFTQSKANNSNYPGVANLQQGALYDALEPTLFLEATGVALSAMGFTPPIKNSQGRLTVGFNRNLDATPSGTWTAASRLVATFNSYDSLGRLSERWKYIGPAPTGRKWHKIKYTYDAQNMLSSTTIFHNETETQIVTQSRFAYDNRGRVTAVLDKNGGTLAAYTYDFQDRITQARLPGSTSVDYSFDIQSKVRSITGSVGAKTLFQEWLGYETKPHPDIADNMEFYGRFDGKVTSLVRKFSASAGDPVEFWRYFYDMPGRMQFSMKHHPLSGGGLKTNGDITFPVTFNSAPIEEKHYDYSDDGAIELQSTAGLSHLYSYTSGTHQLKSVIPNLPGRITSAGSFQYDRDGRLYRDNGSGKIFIYNYMDRPVSLQILTQGKAFHFFYDENDNRVATLEDQGSIVGRKIYVYEAGLKVVKEIVNRTASHPDGALDLVKYHEYGQNGLVAVGYGDTNDRQVPIKDHQGNVMMVVLIATSGVAKEQGYEPYGTIQKRVVQGSDLEVSQAYTGKEFDEPSGLYYFGARFFDPELGLWLVPDAAGQYTNPYSYGGAPVNGVDADGNWFIVDDIIGGVVGAGIGAYTAYKNGYDLTDWQTYAYIGGGAAIGVATVETGGAAGSAFSSLGAVGSGIAAGGAGGAFGALANYSLGSGIETGFSNYNAGNAWQATWTGAVGGAVGGGVGRSGIFGRGVVNAFGSGFAGGATGAALNGANARGILMGGLISGSVSAGGYTVRSGINEVYPKNSHGTRKVTAERGASDQEKEIARDFKGLRASGMKSTGSLSETGATYRDANAFDRWLRGPGTLVVRTNSLSQPGGAVNIQPGLGDDYQVHSHPVLPGGSSIGVSGIDGDIGQALQYPDVKFYLWADELPQQQMYQYDGQFNFYHLIGY